jgi:hypothetical protein
MFNQERKSMKSKFHGTAGKAAAAFAVAVGVLGFVGAPAAFAAGTSAGSATVLDPATNKPLNSGGSQTTWTIGLPAQAHCTKDTATNSYHVFSYEVSTTTVPDPGTLTFSSAGPSAGNPLYDTTAGPYISANTAPTTGQVIGLPNFNWALFSPDGVAGIANPNGVYNVGIACADATNQGDVFWNVVVTFAASTADPNGQTWTAANPAANVPESPLTIALPLSAVVLVGAGAVVVRRRRSQAASSVAV